MHDHIIIIGIIFPTFYSSLSVSLSLSLYYIYYIHTVLYIYLCTEHVFGVNIHILSSHQDRWHSAAWRDAMDRRQQIPTENRALINPQLSGQNCGSTLEYPWTLWNGDINGDEWSNGAISFGQGCQPEAVPLACTGVNNMLMLQNG